MGRLQRHRETKCAGLGQKLWGAGGGEIGRGDKLRRGGQGGGEFSSLLCEREQWQGLVGVLIFAIVFVDVIVVQDNKCLMLYHWCQLGVIAVTTAIIDHHAC